MAEGGRSEPDVEAHRLTRRESRAVLDHQIATLNDLDDKAMRTVRTDVVLLGILASAAGITGPERLSQLHIAVQTFSMAAGACLFISAIIGTGVFVASDITYGIGQSYRREISEEAYSERDWLNVLIRDYDDWTESMRETNENNSFHLTVAQGFLTAALLFLMAGTSLLALPLQL